MGINQIVTPLDSAVLETKEQYKVYFKIVTHAFEEMLQAMDREKICHAIELSFLQRMEPPCFLKHNNYFSGIKGKAKAGPPLPPRGSRPRRGRAGRPGH